MQDCHLLPYSFFQLQVLNTNNQHFFHSNSKSHLSPAQTQPNPPKMSHDQPITPLTCPTTVTVRRNPPRRARPNPTPSKPINHHISSLLLSPPPNKPPPPPPEVTPSNNSLNVFLRIRPLQLPTTAAQTTTKKRPLNSKHGGVKSSNSNSCLTVNDSHSVTVIPPACDSGRLKSEVYGGFSHVFPAVSSQDEVYDKMMRPIVDEFLSGRSGLLAALGPSGSGKTYTVFGSVKEPGLVPRAFRHIFESNVGLESISSRSFYLSVFEIYSEKGKGEKLSDLSPDGGDIFIQQSAVKGLKEVLIRDVAEAESVLAHAKSKRATAMTNSNSQSSRSQCIINIRCCIDEIKRKSESLPSGPVLTFIDLAGAEREKKTGNQGGRLLESNFINNTSMVFSLCLRSLLEHQKNPKKPLQKHFQSSLLTKYLRDYLEGRKRMALILTARSGPEDYFDASFLLRQASPFMEIKFHNVEEASNLPNKRRRKQVAGTEQQKNVKLCDADEKNEVLLTSEASGNYCKKDTGLAGDTNGYRTDDMLGVSENVVPAADNPNVKLQREYYVVQSFAKALWNVLKQYKEREKAMQNEIDVLTENLRSGNDQLLMMEKELRALKSQCSCQKQAPVTAVFSSGGANTESRVGALEELIGIEQVASANEQGCEDFEPEVNPILHSAGEHCSMYPENEPLGVDASEEQKSCSPFKQEATNLFQKKDELDHFGGEVAELFTSEAECERKTTIPENQESEKDFGLNVSHCMEDGSEELQNFGFINETKVQIGDSSLFTNNFAFTDEKKLPDTILRIPSEETPASLNCESSFEQVDKVQFSPMECEISHDDSQKFESHENLDAIEKVDKAATDAAAGFSQNHVTDQKVQQDLCLDDTDEQKDKENVTSGPERNSLEQETKEKSDRKPSTPIRPKRRLMPASSLLLRDVGSIDIADESIKCRGGRGGQKSVDNGLKSTRGNASLLRLLKNHLPR